MQWILKAEEKALRASMNNHSLSQPGMAVRGSEKGNHVLIGLQGYPFNPRVRMIPMTDGMVLEAGTPAFWYQTPSCQRGWYHSNPLNLMEVIYLQNECTAN